MPPSLSRIPRLRHNGTEPFHADGHPLGMTLLDFWRWSASDLVSNATRGILAEFIVASALGINLDSVRDEWSAYDLQTPVGITVEVKSAAYIQSWSQQKPSIITFRIPCTQGWNAESNTYEQEFRRQAQVYVFALQAHQDKATIDPLNVDQWKFYVISTRVLDEKIPKQKTIGLKSLEALAGKGIPYQELRAAVIKAAEQRASW